MDDIDPWEDERYWKSILRAQENPTEEDTE